MSQQMMTLTIEKLWRDEDLRARFAVDRIEVIATLSVLGISLTPDEIDVLYQADVRVWSSIRAEVEGVLH